MGRVTAAELKWQLQSILDPGGYLDGKYDIQGTALTLPDGSTTRLLESPLPTSFSHTMRIILDPGHIGGTWQDLRRIQVGDGRIVREGDLTWLTVVRLRSLLANDGHTVTLTRTRGQPVTTLLPESVSDDPNLFPKPFIDTYKRWQVTDGMEDATIRRALLWLQSDIDARRELIALSGADFGLSLHYAGDLKNAVTDANGIFAILSGNYTEAYLSELDNQMMVMRMALSGNLLIALHLCQTILSEMTDRLRVPYIATEAVQSDGFHLVSEGVFSADLRLLKQCDLPLAIIEGPYQNNRAELKKSDSTRSAEFSLAVYAGIRRWIAHSHPTK